MGKWEDEQVLIFSLSASNNLSEKIVAELGEHLGVSENRQFSDGEIQINIEQSVRGREVYLIQATNYPVNDNLMELLIMIDAVKRASAKSVNVVMPYFGYARQDRTARPREPITAKLVADMLTAAGADRVLTLELHAVQVQGFFDIPVDNLFTVPLFVEYFRDKGLVGDDVVVVSPKNSGVKRARSLAEYLDCPMAIIDYEEDDKAREHGYIIGEVAGKKAIMIDDMLNTGTTFYAGSDVLEKAGASEIYACASHALLSANAKELMDLTAIKEIVVTDSVDIPENRVPKNLKTVTASKLIAEAIRRIHENKPMSSLFAYDKGTE